MRNFFTTALLSVVALASPVLANNLILVPTGTTLTTGQVRAEAAISVDGSRAQYYWLGTGLQQFELNLTRFQKPHLDAENVVDIQWSFLPETILTPAIAFGVNDLADQSGQGVGPYAVITRHLPVGQGAFLLKSFAATVGVGAVGLRGPFCGFQAELPANFVIQGEYDSRDFNVSIGWQPVKLLMLKAYSIRRENYVGAELVPITF
jgi:hypothetical protein